MIKLFFSIVNSISSKFLSSNKKCKSTEISKSNVKSNKTEQVAQKKWYHLSFFYRGTDFQPIYFYIFCFVCLLFWLSYLKTLFYFGKMPNEVSDTFIITVFTSIITTFGLFNQYNQKS